MISFDDDQVLESLTAALAPAPVEPTFRELVALRTAVTEHAAGRRPGFLHRLRRPVPAAALALALAGGGAGVAVVSGAVMPRPVRTVVQAVGLPVDSVAVARVRHDMEELREALDSGDAKAIAPAASRLRGDAARLSASDSDKVHDEVTSLLVTADRVLATPSAEPPASGAADSPVTTTPVPVAPTAPPTTATGRSAAGPATTTSMPPSADDHGGSSDSGNSGPGSTSSGSGRDGSDDGGTSGHSGPG